MIFRLIGALAIGALGSYFFDPVLGKRRRERLRHRLGSGELRNRTRGFVAEARGMVERRLGERRQSGSHVHTDPSSPQP